MSLVTLTSDFGHTDYYVALLKAAIMRYEPTIAIVDISHHIQRHDIMEASFYLSSAYTHFPKGTIHIASINTFYSQKSELILLSYEGHFFIGPNNGLFSLVFPEVSNEHIFRLSDDMSSQNQYDLLGRSVHSILHDQVDQFQCL